MSSLNAISTDQLGKRLVGGEEGGRSYFARPHPFIQQVSGHIFKDDMNRFSSTSDICFLH